MSGIRVVVFVVVGLSQKYKGKASASRVIFYDPATKTLPSVKRLGPKLSRPLNIHFALYFFPPHYKLTLYISFYPQIQGLELAKYSSV